MNMRLVCVLALATAMAPVARAGVLTFDDLPPGTAFFTADYRGFRFGTNDIATNAWFHTNDLSPVFTPSTPTKIVATDYTLYSGDAFEQAQPISSMLDFVFNGAEFSGFDRVRFDLYLDGARVHTSANSPELGSVPVFVASGYGGLVNAVVVRGTQGFYALDNFTFNVPEPRTYALAGLALVAAGAMRRKVR
jgi:hypothetical protein